MQIIDINGDLGEGYGVYTKGSDRELMGNISSANIACGFHAGDPLIMKNTVKMAIDFGVGIGAHPSFLDLLGFGRRPLEVEPERLKQEIIYQLGALGGIASSEGGSLVHCKPHGSLNNLAAKDKELALLIAEAIASYDENLILIAPILSCLGEAGEEMGLVVAFEVYGDRAYQRDGQLLPRSIPGAVLTDVDLVVERVLRLVEEEEVETIEGELLSLHFHTICVHGDTKGSVEMAVQIKKALQGKGLEIAPLSSFLSS